MTIGIDARMLGAGYGIGRYVSELISHLETLRQTEDSFVIFLRKDNWESYHPTNPRFTKVLADVPWYGWKEQLVLPWIFFRHPVDLMHFPHWNVPVLYLKPYVMTMHDLTMFWHPRPDASTRLPLVYWVKHFVHKFVVRYALLHARHIITVSEWVRQDVARTFRIPLSKMTTVYQAPFGKLKTQNSKLKINTQDEDVRILEKYSVEKPYILYVGAAYPHKNLQRLIEAWRVARERFATPTALVLVGKEDAFYTKVKKMIEADADIVYLGFVPDEELESLYAHARLFVFPSLSEGFGLPPLEAMMRGIPVIASNATCLPEVLGEGALYFDPEDVGQMAETIVRGVEDDELRGELIVQGREETQRYSWERAAKQIVHIYQEKKK